MTDSEFEIELNKIGIELTSEQKRQFKMYVDTLLEYNKHTNLTAIRDESGVYLLHFFDSLLMTKYFDIKGKRVLDIGSGAGFPGIPLKICFPDIDLVVLDSNGKKTEFLSQLKKVLNIEYTVINDRAEKYILEERETFDVVTSRAVTAMPVLAELSMPFVKLQGYFIPYKGKMDASLEGGNYAILELGGEVDRVEECLLPKNEATRTFIFVQKKRKTPAEYPRQYDKIVKKPLQKL